MRKIANFFKTTILGGFFVVLPIAVLLILFEKLEQMFGVIFKSADELLVLLISPCPAERGEMIVDDGQAVTKFTSKLFQASRELTHFLWVDNGLRHSEPPAREKQSRVERKRLESIIQRRREIGKIKSILLP